jgi:hypothetical protein
LGQASSGRRLYRLKLDFPGIDMNNAESSSKKYSFIAYYLGVFTRPGRAFEALMADQRRLKFGLIALSINAVLYNFVYIFLFFGGGQPFKPWLAIPLEEYYRYNMLFLAPSMFMCWILSAGVAQLLSHLFSGKGSFEDNLSVFGFGIGVASWSTLFHDLLTSFLGAVHIINQRAYEVALNSPTIWRTILWILMIAYVIWFPILFYKGVTAAQRIRRASAILVSILAFVVYQLLFFVFNR